MLRKSFFYLLIPIAFVFVVLQNNSTQMTPEPVAFRSNPELTTIFNDADFQGTPIDGANRFMNRFQPFQSDMKSMLKWQLSSNPFKAEKKSDSTRLNVFKDADFFNRTESRITWIGHASFLIHLGGKTLLIDPVFTKQPLLKRYSDLPFDPDSLRNIDYLLISHDHRDHCDKKSIQLIAERSPNLKILTGLNVGTLVENWVGNLPIQEAGWYQKYNIDDDFEIIYVPSRHWSRRGLLDESKRLWGGFFIKYGSTSIYFMGDSGYGPHFKEIAEICGRPDYALMGVGAFEPQWFMHPVHMSPTDAWKAFNDLGGRHFIPMHYGTFDLSDEPLLHPLNVLEKLEKKEMILQPPGVFIPID